MSAAQGHDGPMRVAVVVPVFPQRSETFIARKVAGLIDRGIDIHVVTGSSPAAHWDDVDHLGLDAHRHRVHVEPTTKSMAAAVKKSPTLAPILAQQRSEGAAMSAVWKSTDGSAFGRAAQTYRDLHLAALKPDLIHAEFINAAAERPDLGRRFAASYLTSIRGQDITATNLDRPDHFAELWPNLDAVHVLGAALESKARERGLPDTLPVWTIPPAVDVPRDSAPLAVHGPGEPLRLLAVGRLRAVKGHEDAITAVAQLAQRGIDVQLRIIGDGDRFEALALARAQLGVTDRVELVGGVNPADVADHLGWCHAVVHPSLAEGFSNAVLEAQAAGRPVIASDAGGLVDNIADGETGIVVPRRSPEAIAQAIETLAEDNDLLRRLGNAGPERVRRHFSFDAQLDRWIDCYRSLDRRGQR